MVATWGVMAREKTWALVSSGVRARILRGLEGGDPADPIEIVSKADSTHLRDIMADKPGRSFASGARGRRSALEPGSDTILRDMQDLAREILGILEGHLHAGRLTRLAVFAAPKMLGILRKEMPASLGEVVFLEMDANLSNLSEHDLRDAVLDYIARERSR